MYVSHAVGEGKLETKQACNNLMTVSYCPIDHGTIQY